MLKTYQKNVDELSAKMRQQPALCYIAIILISLWLLSELIYSYADYSSEKRAVTEIMAEYCNARCRSGMFDEALKPGGILSPPKDFKQCLITCMR